MMRLYKTESVKPWHPIGTGRIYGDHVAIAATTLTNDVETVNGVTSVDVSRTNIDRVAGLYVTNPSGTGILVASADNNINLQGAVISNAGGNSAENGGATVIDAGHDLNLSTITTTANNSYVRNARNYNKNSSTQEVGTIIQTDSDLTLNAGNNITARAANVTSDNGTLTARAGNDLTIEAGKATYASESASYKKKNGTFSSKSKTRRDTANGTDVIGSTFSGDNVNIAAGNNLAVKASNIVSTNDVNLNAGNNVTLTTEQATHDETHYSKTKKSGFTASSTSIGYGSSTLTNTNDSQQVINVGSTVGSVQGNVNITSGKTYTQTGSDILTPQGSINITAQQVNITNATDTYANQQSMKYKQSGITLAVTNPVISAIQTAQQMSKAAGKTDDPRMQALAAGTAALAANNAKDAIIAGNTPRLDEHGLEVLDANGKNTAENPANQVGGINVSLSIGTSKSSSKTTQTNSTAKSSTINAGGDVNVTATGAGKDSDINVIGSQIKAAHDVTLKAEDEVNLLAAQNVDTLNGKSKGSSASLGISFGTDGFLVTAGLSGSKGKTKGNGTTWTETQVQSGNKAGDTVTLQSGTDTNIKGAQVIGNQVIANVGTNGHGDLTIKSLQDTNRYKDKQQSIGGSVSVGYGKMGGSFNYSDSSTKSNYQSVSEQSGIFAGDGGFQVNVNGNTDLKGAVIASTDKAIQDNRNSLTTETLTTSNIENKAEYEASSTSLGGGYSASGNGVGLDQDGKAQTGGTQVPGTSLPSLKGFSASLPSAMSASDQADSTTVSGVSRGNINVTNATAQTALTGKDAATTVATLNQDVQTQLSTDSEGNTTAIAVDSQGNNLANTLTPIFTEEKKAEIQAGFEIVGAFTQQVGTFLNHRAQEASAAQKTIDDELKKPAEQRNQDAINQATQVLQDNQTWAMGGTGRIALTAITAAFSGNVTGSGTELMQSATIHTLQALGAQEIKAMAEQLGGEGSVAHTALHAVLACAGAAATGGDCGTGALAASSGVVINKLLDSIEGTNSNNLTATEKEARLNLITTLVTGVTAALGGDAAVANTAVTIETENNALTITQLQKLAQDLKNCSPGDMSCIGAKMAEAVKVADKQGGVSPTGTQALNERTDEMLSKLTKLCTVDTNAGCVDYAYTQTMNARLACDTESCFNDYEKTATLAIALNSRTGFQTLIGQAISDFGWLIGIGGQSAGAMKFWTAAKQPVAPGQSLTQAGRAVTKHPEYFGFETDTALRQVYRTDAQRNQLGFNLAEEALQNGVKTTGAGNGRYPNGWVTYTLPDGRAVSWEPSGKFIGFRGTE